MKLVFVVFEGGIVSSPTGRSVMLWPKRAQKLRLNRQEILIQKQSQKFSRSILQLQLHVLPLLHQHQHQLHRHNHHHHVHQNPLLHQFLLSQLVYYPHLCRFKFQVNLTSSWKIFKYFLFGFVGCVFCLLNLCSFVLFFLESSSFCLLPIFVVIWICYCMVIDLKSW